MAENKTNAMRMLDRAKVPYTPHTYETDGEHVDGITVATSIGRLRRSWSAKRPQRLSEKKPCR